MGNLHGLRICAAPRAGAARWQPPFTPACHLPQLPLASHVPYHLRTHLLPHWVPPLHYPGRVLGLPPNFALNMPGFCHHSSLPASLASLPWILPVPFCPLLCTWISSGWFLVPPLPLSDGDMAGDSSHYTFILFPPNATYHRLCLSFCVATHGTRRFARAAGRIRC